MKAGRHGIARGAALLLLSGAGCSKDAGPAGDPRDRMFEASYERFVASAKAHAGACEISLQAKGDDGEKAAGIAAAVEVDDSGGYRLDLDDRLEVVRVGSVAWQREKGGRFERVESGARPDLLRDDAVAGWRDVLAPLRDRLDLTRTGASALGGRKVETYEITAEPGGGEAGGIQVVEGTGTVGLDAATGFPVALTFEGSWVGPATPPAEGRVTWVVQKLECAVTGLGGVATITPPVPAPTPTPVLPAVSPGPSRPASTPKASPPATPRARATPKKKTR